MNDVKIRCDDCKFVENCVDYGWQGCRKFTPKPTEPKSNEEWLRSCTTEQLAEYILNVWLDGALNVNAEFGLNEAQIERHKKYIVEWLKEMHHG